MSRKQTVENLLNGLTSKEMDEYIKDNNLINKDMMEKYELLKRHCKPDHFSILTDKASSTLQKGINDYYKIGQAQIISMLLNCFYDGNFNITDVKTFFKKMMDGDKLLKEYTYEIMKGLK
jgi:hypothetical protein